MDKTNTYKLVLEEVFYRIRTDLNLPLGVDEYHLLLRAFERGYGLLDRARLARLMEAIWLKSNDKREYLKNVLNEVIGKYVSAIEFEEARTAKEKEKKTGTGEDGNSSGNTTQSQQKQNNQHQTNQPDPTKNKKQQDTTAEDLEEEMKIETEEMGMVLDIKIEEGEGQPNPEDGIMHFLLDESHLPFSMREMKQSWRFLRNPVGGGISDEIDLPGTVRTIARDGMFTELVYKPSTINKTQLLILLDHQGSMIAFDALGEQLSEAAIDGGGHPKAMKYYFRNHPENYLYKDKAHLNGEHLSRVFLKYTSPYTSVLIFSDAGAARGTHHPLRVHQTARFLTRMRLHTSRIAWLNPLPSWRWEGTSAEEIAALVPMFECLSPEEMVLYAGTFRNGLDQSIQILKGKADV